MLRYFFGEGFFFNQIYNNYIVKNILSFSYNIYKFIDKGFLVFPFETVVNAFSQYIVSFQTVLYIITLLW